MKEGRRRFVIIVQRFLSLLVSLVSLQGGNILHKGTPVPVFSEKDVFKALDIPYAEPKDRNL